MILALAPWFCLMGAAIIASIILLFWGYRSGQFSDQERARYLPLRNEKLAAPEIGKRHQLREMYVLGALMVMTGMAFAAAVGIAILKTNGG